MIVALVDGDIIVYSVAFAAENVYYEVGGNFFPKKSEALDWLEQHPECDSEIVRMSEPEPNSHAIYSAKKVLEKIEDRIRDTLGREEHFRMSIHLTGSGNFRDEVAVTVPYKGTRKPEKPVHYETLRDWLFKSRGATINHGLEADDAIAIEHLQETKKGNTSIICTLDKDLNMIEGRHYNWRKDEFYLVSKQDAVNNFHKQLLTGDTSDNIKGIPRVGDKTALKKIGDCFTNSEVFCMIGREYAKHFDNPEERLLENGQLLWMLRSYQDEWTIDKWTETLSKGAT